MFAHAGLATWSWKLSQYQPRCGKISHECTDERTHARTNEYTGLHPVLGYLAPSGLGGSMDNPDSLAWPRMHEL